MKKNASGRKKPSRPAAELPSLPLSSAAGWTFLTNHMHVLLCLYRQPDQRLRDVALAVGITERMVVRLIGDLDEAGYLQITKVGRCNRYSVHSQLRLRHPLECHHTIGALLELLSTGPGESVHEES